VLRDLRAALRRELGRPHPDGLQDWVVRLDVRPVLTPDGSPWPVVMVPARTSCAGELLCAALDAVNRGLWHRLRACPDCRYVFFDSSRNGSRTWCRMTRDDPSGRSCGTLAKARAKRARDRAARPPST
jgi:predicted RNA-binding Zn ribbon-like protein